MLTAVAANYEFAKAVCGGALRQQDPDFPCP